MRVLSLPLPLTLRERNPYFIFGRHEAEAELRASVAEGYAGVYGKYKTTHVGGMVRWADITENLASATERFGTQIVNRGGQRRLCWPGMAGESAEIIVLRGTPGDDRFDTNERRIRSEEHSLLAPTSFRNESDDPMTIGSYLFHDKDAEEGWCEAWFVAQGWTREGLDYVLCEERVDLGRIRFLGRGGGDLEPVDLQP